MSGTFSESRTERLAEGSLSDAASECLAFPLFECLSACPLPNHFVRILVFPDS
jgi:hypothetical protein